MSDYLTPAELDEWADELERYYPPGNKCAPTLRAYADVVEGVAELIDPVCFPEDGEVYCVFGCAFDWGSVTHSPDCLWKRARELAGHE